MFAIINWFNRGVMKNNDQNYVEPSFKSQRWVNEVPFALASVSDDPNFGAPNKSRWLNRIFADDTTEVWQPDVYKYAEKIASKKNLHKVVDIGCGSGDKLCIAFDSSIYETTGIDYAGSLKIVRQTHPERRWVEANLSDSYAVDHVFEEFQDNQARLFILSDVIEHILDPRILLRKLRVVLKNNPDNRLIISTPDPAKSKSTLGNGLPGNDAHVREWDLGNLVSFLKASGFKIEKAGHTRSNNLDKKKMTNIIAVSASEDSHLSSIESLGLPSPKNSIIITTEHADTVSTGGIGSYVKEVEEVCGKDRPIVLYCGKQPFEEVKNVEKVPENIIDIRQIFKDATTDLNEYKWKSVSQSVLEAMKSILFVYDQVTVVEYQDYQGIGARLAEAKKAAMISGGVQLRVRCHGSQIYTERAGRTWGGLSSADAYELERIGIENADVVSSATQYLLDLYEEEGYLSDQSNCRVDRLPYRYGEADYPKKQRVNKLIFVGKRSTMKGFDDFVKMCEKVTEKTTQIKSILVYGNPGNAVEEYDQRLRNLCTEKEIKLLMGPVPRAELMKVEIEYSSNGLFLLPYGADNHPVAVLEMIENNCRFIAYKTGGIPEIVPEDHHSYSLCEPNAEALTSLVQKRLQNTDKIDAERAKKIRGEAVADQIKINEQVRGSYLSKPKLSKKEHMSVFSGDLVTVMVPTYNMDLEYIEDLCYALNEQSLQPGKVLFVNDGSRQGYELKLRKAIQKNLKLDYEILSHEKNKGLAAGRNTALASTTTKYLINVDADDIPLNDFIYDYVSVLENNQEYSAVVCALKAFKNKEDNWNVRKYDDERHRYIGVGANTALGIIKNSYGHASSCVKTEVAKELGGWDDSDRSTWEDWAFYTRLYGAGHKIFTIPKINYLYRVRVESMARTYDNHEGQLRIMRNLEGVIISRWDAYQLFSMMQDYHFMHQNFGKEADDLRRRYSVRLALKTVGVIDRFPKLKSGLGKAARAGYKSYMKLSN